MNVTPQLLNGVFGFIDDLFTTQEERDAAKLKAMEIAAAGGLAQLEVNAKEAQHKNVFVAGWRPFIGWTCGAAFVWAFLLSPIIETIAFYAFAIGGHEVDLTGLPTLDLAAMMPVLMGMLGLGGLRTFEKYNGKA